MTMGWRKLHNEERNNFTSGVLLKEDGMSGTCSMHGKI
jgi:hypothetical protein